MWQSVHSDTTLKYVGSVNVVGGVDGGCSGCDAVGRESDGSSYCGVVGRGTEESGGD